MYATQRYRNTKKKQVHSSVNKVGNKSIMLAVIT